MPLITLIHRFGPAGADADADAARALRADACRHLLGAAVAMAAAMAIVGTLGGLSAWFALKGALVAGCGFVIVWRGLPAHRTPTPTPTPASPNAPLHRRFGAGNRVTLLRLAMVAMLAGLIGEAALADAASGPWWSVVLGATVAALLDAADGPLARRQGMASALGARFDMEVDAFFILVLCALIVQAGKAPAWVLTAGLMRYAFVAAAAWWPWLSRPLPASRRRKVVCVALITALIVCLGPIVSAAATAIAAAAVAAVSASFAVDVGWLARRRHHGPVVVATGNTSFCGEGSR
jgi:phosphatidylglycerophosphate synthase